MKDFNKSDFFIKSCYGINNDWDNIYAFMNNNIYEYRNDISVDVTTKTKTGIVTSI